MCTEDETAQGSSNDADGPAFHDPAIPSASLRDAVQARLGAD